MKSDNPPNDTIKVQFLTFKRDDSQREPLQQIDKSRKKQKTEASEMPDSDSQSINSSIEQGQMVFESKINRKLMRLQLNCSQLIQTEKSSQQHQEKHQIPQNDHESIELEGVQGQSSQKISQTDILTIKVNSEGATSQSSGVSQFENDLAQLCSETVQFISIDWENSLIEQQLQKKSLTDNLMIKIIDCKHNICKEAKQQMKKMITVGIEFNEEFLKYEERIIRQSKSLENGSKRLVKIVPNYYQMAKVFEVCLKAAQYSTSIYFSNYENSGKTFSFLYFLHFSNIITNVKIQKRHERKMKQMNKLNQVKQRCYYGDQLEINKSILQSKEFKQIQKIPKIFYLSLNFELMSTDLIMAKLRDQFEQLMQYHQSQLKFQNQIPNQTQCSDNFNKINQFVDLMQKVVKLYREVYQIKAVLVIDNIDRLYKVMNTIFGNDNQKILKKHFYDAGHEKEQKQRLSDVSDILRKLRFCFYSNILVLRSNLTPTALQDVCFRTLSTDYPNLIVGSYQQEFIKFKKIKYQLIDLFLQLLYPNLLSEKYQVDQKHRSEIQEYRKKQNHYELNNIRNRLFQKITQNFQFFLTPLEVADNLKSQKQQSEHELQQIQRSLTLQTVEDQFTSDLLFKIFMSLANKSVDKIRQKLKSCLEQMQNCCQKSISYLSYFILPTYRSVHYNFLSLGNSN